jgi:hypothetical protein
MSIKLLFIIEFEVKEKSIYNDIGTEKGGIK